MKKNRMMRLASGLLVAVLLTTSVISGTFAKYTTSASSQDSARVAKFGVTITGTTGDANQAFAKEYQDNDANYSGVSVAASENVVAPGTSGSFSNFSVEGKPEVAVRISYDNVAVKLENWIADTDADGVIDEEYCPIIIYVNDVPYNINGTTIKDVNTLQSTVVAAIQEKGADYGPGTDLSAVNDDLNISWVWAFEGESPSQNDKNDTELGNWAKNEKSAPKISITATCTVTQID